MPDRAEKYILAADLGTSGPKCALVSVHGKILADVSVKNELFLHPGGGAEQDPGQWWTSVLECFKALLDKRLVPAEDIDAICCSSQWSGTVAVDRKGRHLANALIWLDSRGSRYIEEITKGFFPIQGYGAARLWRWIRLTGGAPSHSGKDSLAHILYIKNRHPEIYENTWKFLEPKDYINLRLTGRAAASYDSIALHWVTDNRDINKIVYDDRLVKLSGVDRQKFPDLLKATDVVGTLEKDTADELGLPQGVRVVCGTPDVQAAAVGSGAVEDFAAHLYIGTSAWLTCHVPFKKTDIKTSIASLPSAVPGRYFAANEQETAGACLTFLRDRIFFPCDRLSDFCGPPDFYGALDDLAGEVSAGSSGLLFLPWLYGERTPIDDRLIRGGFVNLSLSATRAHMARAVLEGVAYNTRWLLSAVEKFTGQRLSPIRMVGGGANSDIWCRIHADVLDRRIAKVKAPLLANVRGAGLLASAALGHIGFEEISGLVETERVYEPDPANKKIYNLMFREFAASYRRIRKVCARLNRRRPGKEEA
ncbi:MAG: xylulokinase [Desulfobacterales bacterium]